MRLSTMRGIAAGSLIGLTVGAGLMMTPQGKRMKRVLSKNGPQLARQVADCWMRTITPAAQSWKEPGKWTVPGGLERSPHQRGSLRLCA